MMTMTNNFRMIALVAIVAGLVVACLFVAVKPAHASTTYTVRSSADKPDLDPNDFECDANPLPDVKECTLRAAIQQASSGVHDTIHFDLPGGPGLKILTLQSALPFIDEAVTINGYSQPGASHNTLQTGTNAPPMIVLDGSQAGNASGLALSSGASGSVIKGLNIKGFSFDGIRLHSNASGVKIEGNFIGTDPSGTADHGNGRNGILLSSASDNTIGGATPAARTLISGNTSNGLATDVQDPSSIGEGNTVLGNLIGTQKNGTADLGNGGDGVELLGTHDNHILDNTIAFNDQDGVAVRGTSSQNAYRNEVLGNSIFSNSGHGIDLNEDGSTPNDVDDADSGANDSQNSPVISSATILDGETTIKGTIDTNPHCAVIVEFFSNPFTLIFNPGFGTYEGKTYLGEKTVFTGDDGHASFTFKPSQSMPEGQRITATATNYDPFGSGVGNTSEFSASRGVIVPDTVAPKVLSTVPKAKATGVRPAANVKAAFSENMLASSINANTFKLFKKGSTTKVAASVSYDAATDRATLNPNKSLQKGVTYKVMVTTRAKDLAGNRLDQKPARTGLQPKVWFFTVKS